MTVTLKIQDTAIPQIGMLLDYLKGEGKIRLQAAGANRFASIVHNNFGFDGEDRPTPWPALSKAYADEFHGGQRIPTLFLSGELQESIQIHDMNLAAAEVFTENEYAEAHQYGDPQFNLPARPFFPMTESGDPTPYALEQMEHALEIELERIINGR